MRMLALALTLLPMVACAQTDDGAATFPEDACGAEGFQGLVGQSGEIARLLVLDQPVRVIGPDTAVTMDLRPDRINFVLDEEDVILRVECG